MRRWTRSWIVPSLFAAAMCFAPHAVAQTAAENRPVPNIAVEPLLQAVAADARTRSATIRRQWDTIARTDRVHVAILVARGPLDSMTRARTTMRRYSSGLLLAIVEIPPADDYVELLAHELEHVIEQIEGVNLSELARRGPEAVRRETGTFETKRAQKAGLTAATEADAAEAADAIAMRPRPARSRPPRPLGGS